MIAKQSLMVGFIKELLDKAVKEVDDDNDNIEKASEGQL